MAGGVLHFYVLRVNETKYVLSALWEFLKYCLDKFRVKQFFEKIYTVWYSPFLYWKLSFFAQLSRNFRVKIRKFAYRWSTLNLNCAKTVTDRKMRFSPLVQKCPSDVQIGSTSVSNKKSSCRRKFRYFFIPIFVTCLRWSCSPIPHGQGMYNNLTKQICHDWKSPLASVYQFLDMGIDLEQS